MREGQKLGFGHPAAVFSADVYPAYKPWIGELIFLAVDIP